MPGWSRCLIPVITLLIEYVYAIVYGIGQPQINSNPLSTCSQLEHSSKHLATDSGPKLVPKKMQFLWGVLDLVYLPHTGDGGHLSRA